MAAFAQYYEHCGVFDKHLRFWVHNVQKNPTSKTLLLYDEFAAVGISRCAHRARKAPPAWRLVGTRSPKPSPPLSCQEGALPELQRAL